MKRVLVPALLVLAGCSSGSDVPSSNAVRSAVEGECPASPPPELFAAGLCVCHDFDSVGDLKIKPLVAGQPSRGGVNGVTELVGTPRIEGDFVAFNGLTGVGEADVTGTLSTTTSLDGVGVLKVGGDLVVGGDLTGVGQLEVGGALRVAGQASITGDSKFGGLGAYTAPALPCACGDTEIFDVVAKVKAARASTHSGDGGIPSLDAVGKTELTLGSGSYFFENVSTVGNSKWNIEGGVEIFIDGDLDQVGAQNIHLAAGATLDLYVSGHVEVVGDTELGAAPGAFRLFIGGTDPVSVAVGDQRFKGSIYAPRAELDFVGDTLIEGSLFAGSVTGVGTLEIHQAGAAATDPALCPGPADQGTTGPNGSDGGSSSDGTALIN